MKTTLETSGEDVKLHSKRAEKINLHSVLSVVFSLGSGVSIFGNIKAGQTVTVIDFTLVASSLSVR